MKMIKEFEGIMPEIDESVFVAESADIIGDVKIGKNSSVWYNTVLRGDEHSNGKIIPKGCLQFITVL